MIQIKKKNNLTTEIKVEIPQQLHKELLNYLRVGKHYKYLDKTVSLNDVIEVVLTNLVEEEGYQSLLTQYNSEMEFKREKDRNRKKILNNKSK